MKYLVNWIVLYMCTPTIVLPCIHYDKPNYATCTSTCIITTSLMIVNTLYMYNHLIIDYTSACTCTVHV